MTELYWLPKDAQWREMLRRAIKNGVWKDLRRLANHNLSYTETMVVDRAIGTGTWSQCPESLKVAVLASCSVDHLLPSIRIGALRRGLNIETFTNDYGMFRQELLDQGSRLARFSPDVILFSLDAVSLCGTRFLAETQVAKTRLQEVLEDLHGLWQIARKRFNAHVVQQTVMPVLPRILGNCERKSPGTPAAIADSINEAILAASASGAVDVLDLNAVIPRDGIRSWYSAPLWHRAKYEIMHSAAPVYGDLFGRLIAARRGLSSKCIVLDLDNTIWGGVVGDDGIDGLRCGTGSADGEAFSTFQKYLLALKERGIVLAVCSKNDEANVEEVFAKHPDMVLKRGDISCLVANWTDKATNIRRISEMLDLGLESFVFVDDNPFERNIVRRELPDVAVPELPDDPSLFTDVLADAGYFESAEITKEDIARIGSYAARAHLKSSASTDLEGYLTTLNMQLFWSFVGSKSLKRSTQLLNKTNQFNVTTRRYSDAEVATLANDAGALLLCFRLIDKFADHGLIKLIIAKPISSDALEIDSWLMSCRVLGRGVESAAFSILAEIARARGFRKLVGHYIPTAKNGIVRDLYQTLGFANVSTTADRVSWEFDLDVPTPNKTKMRLIEESDG